MQREILLVRELSTSLKRNKLVLYENVFASVLTIHVDVQGGGEGLCARIIRRLTGQFGMYVLSAKCRDFKFAANTCSARTGHNSTDIAHHQVIPVPYNLRQGSACNTVNKLISKTLQESLFCGTKSDTFVYNPLYVLTTLSKVKFLPPNTSQRSVKDAPSEKGPTTDVSVAPDSLVTTIFCGGTETIKKRLLRCLFTNKEETRDRDFNEGPLKLTQSDGFTKRGQLTSFL